MHYGVPIVQYTATTPFRRSLDGDRRHTGSCVRRQPRRLYCVGLLVGLPKKTTAKLQRVLGAVAASRVKLRQVRYD